MDISPANSAGNAGKAGGAIPIRDGRYVVRSFHHSFVTAGIKALVITPLLLALPIEMFDLAGELRVLVIIVAVLATIAAYARCWQIKLLIDDDGIEARDFWRPERMMWNEMEGIEASAGDLLNVTFGTEVAFNGKLAPNGRWRRSVSSAATTHLKARERQALHSLLKGYADRHRIGFHLTIAPNGNWETTRSSE